jgi:hypothetical protein
MISLEETSWYSPEPPKLVGSLLITEDALVDLRDAVAVTGNTLVTTACQLQCTDEAIALVTGWMVSEAEDRQRGNLDDSSSGDDFEEEFI